MAANEEHTKWVLDLVDGMSKNLQGITDNVQRLTVKLDAVEKSVKGVNAIDLSAIAGSFDALHNRLNTAVEPGIRFQDTMADLSAMTGVTGKALEEIGGNARDLTKELGGEASDSVEVYKLLLGQLTPELAKQPALLNEMARNAILLGKTMGGDTAGAVEVLTTAMNQFDVDTDDPIAASKEMARMMNVMAAAAAEGSAELPQLKEGLIEAGGSAKRAGLSFEETAAAIEVLDKAGLKGSRGGIALRNVLSTLSQGRFLPKEVKEELQAAGIDVGALGDKSKSLKERMALLAPIAQDSALMTKLFGRESAGAAQGLIGHIDLLGEYTEKVSGTTTATDQAAVVMDTFSQKMSRLKAWTSDIGISIFGVTKNLIPFIDAGFSGVAMLADLGNAQKGLALIMDTRLVRGIGAAITAMRGMTVVQMLQAGVTGIVTAATAAWNLVLSVNPIVWVVGLIALLVGSLIYAWENFEGFRGFLYGLWASVKVVFRGIGDIVATIFKAIAAVVMGVGQTLSAVFRNPLEPGYFDGIMAGVKATKEAIVGLADLPGNVMEKMRQNGVESGIAFAVGSAEGIENFRKEKKEQQANGGAPATGQGSTAQGAVDASGAGLNAGKLLSASSGGAATGAGAGKSGGGGGDKNIAMNITLNQRFDVAKQGTGESVEAIAQRVVQMITNYTRDAAYTL